MVAHIARRFLPKGIALVHFPPIITESSYLLRAHAGLMIQLTNPSLGSFADTLLATLEM